MARYFTGLLEDLGFRATMKLLPIEKYFGYLEVHDEEVQMAGYWMQNDSRQGWKGIVGNFTCPDFPGTTKAGEPNGFCSEALDEKVRQAQALESIDPSAANRLWAEIDAAIVDEAPAVMPINPTDVVFLSQRVGGYEHHPSLQVMLDQLWVQ
jgi:peptide/nickel transport system substrate-binding protein